jgi:hypothetical protein
MPYGSNQRELTLYTLGIVALLMYLGMVDPETGDGGIPCLWKTLCGFSCPGCGLSRAGALLLHGRFVEAAEMNWLVFPIAAVSVRNYLVRSLNLGR